MQCQKAIKPTFELKRTLIEKTVMTVVPIGLLYVLKRFPEHEEAITRLYRKNESFRILVNDYGRCEEALRHWRRLASGEAPLRAAEYAALLQELEADILGYLGVPS